MTKCVLCLQANTDFNKYISINSSQWLNLKILSTIEKHFWPFKDNLQGKVGICHLCWSKVHDFHTFYRTIEEAHRRDIKISLKKEDVTNNCVKMEAFQLSNPQIFKTAVKSIEESEITIVAIDKDIKVEVPFNEDESLHCPLITKTKDEINCNHTSKERRKRGRPPKNCNKNEVHIKKPKGKRGRPRKYILGMGDKSPNKNSFRSDLIGPCPNIENSTTLPSKAKLTHRPNCKHERDSLQQTVTVKGKVKRRRGRPRKIQIINETAFQDVGVPNSDVVTDNQCPEVQMEDEFKGIDSNSNKSEKLVDKKNILSSIMRKRKRIQQHKALMRNYIATSVRCMKFLRK